MGAIYGFTGPHDDALADRMAATLRHRGGRASLLHIGPTVTLGYLGRLEDDARTRCAAGLHSDGEWSIALAGYLTHEPGTNPRTLAGLLDEFRTQGPECVAGWHGMRKEELIEALLDVSGSSAAEPSRNVRSVARLRSPRRRACAAGRGRPDPRPGG